MTVIKGLRKMYYFQGMLLKRIEKGEYPYFAEINNNCTSHRTVPLESLLLVFSKPGSLELVKIYRPLVEDEASKLGTRQKLICGLAGFHIHIYTDTNRYYWKTGPMRWKSFFFFLLGS